MRRMLPLKACDDKAGRADGRTFLGSCMTDTLYGGGASCYGRKENLRLYLIFPNTKSGA